MKKAADNHSQKITHLKKDKVLAGAIQRIELTPGKKNTDLYLDLMRAIVGQQLSVKAAATIWGRFLDLFNDRYPHCDLLLNLTDEQLRAVGLSYQKAGYLKNIANFSITKGLDYKKLKTKTDQELIDYLVEIKGVGRWTVEMILMFSLDRPDVFPKDDLGIQQGMADLYKIKSKNKKQLFSKMEKIAQNWRPYRTLACMYIWRYKDSAKSKESKVKLQKVVKDH